LIKGRDILQIVRILVGFVGLFGGSEKLVELFIHGLVSLDRVLRKFVGVGVGMILLGLCRLPFACKQPRTKGFLAQLPRGGDRPGNCSCITLLPTL